MAQATTVPRSEAIAGAIDGFVRLLMSMSEDDPKIREPMRLEYVHRWVPPDVSGYVDLLEAVRQAADGAVVGRSAVVSGPP